MNRNILVLVVVGILVVMLGVISFAFVWFTGLPGVVNLPGIKPKQPPPATPFTLGELEDLLEKPDKAAQSIPRIVSCFWTDDEGMRAQASEVLKKIGAQSVDPLRAQLKVKIPAVRFWIVQALGAIGPDAAGAADDLLACVQDDDADVRYKAVYALGRIGVKSDQTTASLLKALADSDERVAETALTVLDEMGAPPHTALPLLGKLAGKDSPESVRPSAIKLLGKLGEPAVPTLKVLLRESAPNDLADLVRAIARLGPHAKPLLPDLESIMLTHEWFDVEQELVGTFKKCGRDGADGLASVLKKVSDPKTPQFDAVRGAVILKAIGEMGAEAKSAVPTLIALLDAARLRPQLLDVLGEIGPAANAAIPAVEALLGEPAIAGEARIALRRMGKIDKK